MKVRFIAYVGIEETMKIKVQEILFQDDRFLLISEDVGIFGRNIQEGAIATKKQFQNGYRPYAYLFSDGTIDRHYETIGTRDDIEFLEIVEIEYDPHLALENMSTGKGWPF